MRKSRFTDERKGAVVAVQAFVAAAAVEVRLDRPDPDVGRRRPDRLEIAPIVA